MIMKRLKDNKIYLFVIRFFRSRMFFENILFLLLFLLIIGNLVGNKSYAVGDSSMMIDPLSTVTGWTWSRLNMGFPSYLVSDVIPLGLFYGFFGLFGLKMNIIQILYYTLFYFGAFTSFKYMIRKLFVNADLRLTYLASIFYVLNPYNLGVPFQDRLFPVFIFLPVVFYFYHRLLHLRQYKYAILISLISILYSGSNINPAIVSVIYLILLLYLVFYLITEKLNKSDFIKLFFLHIFLCCLFLLINSWWLITFVPFNLEVAMIGAGENAFRPTGYGYFFDHFRLLGQWAWLQSYYLFGYFPYSGSYYKSMLLVSSFSITFISLLVLIKFKIKNTFERNQKMLLIFFFFLFLVGIFLANGSKYEIGKLFMSIYNSSSLFWMYREPWAKFGPLIVFSLPILFFGSLSYLILKFKRKFLAYALEILFLIIIVFNVYPFFSRDLIWRRWNGTMRNSEVVVPDYWRELEYYLKKNGLQDEKIFLAPRNLIYAGFNWKNGFFTADNPAVYLLKNPILRAAPIRLYNSDFLIDAFFTSVSVNKDIKVDSFLSFLDVDYILQENDVDWRYSGGKVLPPSESMEKIEEGDFEKVVEFGKFTPEYLQQIPNEEPKRELHDELYQELENRPALVLYKAKDECPHSRFYLPKHVWLSEEDIEDMPVLASNFDCFAAPAIYLENQNLNVFDSFKKDIQLFSNSFSVSTSSVISLEEDLLPIVEYKKINPIKYKVLIRGARDTFPLVFSESFHKWWRVYPVVGTVHREHFYETYFKKYLSESGHLVVNGYANSWLINTQELCDSSRKCVRNDDGSYDIALVVEFWPQRVFYFSLFISVVTLILSVSYLIYNFYFGKITK